MYGRVTVKCVTVASCIVTQGCWGSSFNMTHATNHAPLVQATHSRPPVERAETAINMRQSFVPSIGSRQGPQYVRNCINMLRHMLDQHCPSYSTFPLQSFQQFAPSATRTNTTYCSRAQHVTHPSAGTKAFVGFRSQFDHSVGSFAKVLTVSLISPKSALTRWSCCSVWEPSFACLAPFSPLCMRRSSLHWFTWKAWWSWRGAGEPAAGLHQNREGPSTRAREVGYVLVC